MVRMGLCLLGFLFFLSCQNTQTPKSELPALPELQEDMVAEILEISGMTDEMQRTLPATHQHFRPIVMPFSPAIQDMFINTVDEVFNPRILYFDLRAFWLENAEPEKTRELLEWLHSPMAREMRALSSNASGGNSQEELQHFSTTFETDSLVQKRMPLYERLEGGTGKSTTDLLISITGPCMKLLNVYHEEDKRLSVEEIDDRVENLRSNMQQYFTQSAQFFFAFSHRNTSDETLNKYVNFYEEGLGKWYREFSRTAFDSVFSRAGKQFLYRIEENFTKAPDPRSINATKEVDSIMSNLGKPILGLIAGTCDDKEWYAFARAAIDTSKQLVLLLQNGEEHPDEYLEMIFPLNGTGTYPLEAGKGLFYRMFQGRLAGSVFESIAGQESSVIIDSYDKNRRLLSGSFRVLARSAENDTISCHCEKFLLRIRD